MPMATSCLVARGVRPSPQTFSLGNSVFSSSRTSRPDLARWYAVVEPAGPAPTTITSAVFSEKGEEWGSGTRHGGISPSSKSVCRPALDMGSLFSSIDHPAEGLPP